MSGTGIQVEDNYTLEYARDLVWEKLNDPEVLATCIRGCTFVERETPHNFRAVIQAHVGEVRKDFHIDLVVDDTHAPADYVLSTQMSAGLFGAVRGKATVRLEQLQAQQTRMFYRADIFGTRLVGKLLPLVEGIARRRVQEFFDEFISHLGDKVGKA